MPQNVRGLHHREKAPSSSAPTGRETRTEAPRGGKRKRGTSPRTRNLRKPRPERGRHPENIGEGTRQIFKKLRPSHRIPHAQQLRYGLRHFPERQLLHYLRINEHNTNRVSPDAKPVKIISNVKTSSYEFTHNSTYPTPYATYNSYHPMGPPTQMWPMTTWPPGAAEPWPTTPSPALPPHQATTQTAPPPITTKPNSSSGWISPRDRSSPSDRKKRKNEKKKKEKEMKQEDSKTLDLDTR